MSSFVREKHGNVIYSVAWSRDIFHDDGDLDANDTGANDTTFRRNVDFSTPRQVRYMATCGGNYVSLYEVEIPPDKKKKKKSVVATPTDPLILRQAYVDRDLDESFFSCAFGGRSLGRTFGYTPVANDNGDIIMSEDDASEDLQEQRKQILRAMTDTQQFDGPQLLCVAGSRSIIKVIDTVQQMLVMTLSGHGNEIYDLDFSPTDEWLLLSASKDESVRLWNLRSGTCVAIFAGHEGHRDSVLTVSWHPCGDRFASGSMDNTVKLWNLGKMTAAHNALQARTRFESTRWDTDAPAMAHTFKAAYEQMPYFSSNKIHHDYVDCVQFVGDLVLSKSIHNNIVLWKPNLQRPTIRGKPSHQKPPNDVFALCEFTTKECDVWFIRFGTNVAGNVLAIGNRQGQIKLWAIDDNPKKTAFALLTNLQCTSIVRMVSFSPDNKCLVAACEDATVWKWDATY